MVSPDNKNYIILAVFLFGLCILLVGSYMAFRRYTDNVGTAPTKNTKSKENYDINVDPLKAQPYDRKETDCGSSYSGSPPKGIGGQYGLTPEYDNNITVGNFVDKYEKDTVFAQYAQDLVPTLMYNQSAYDIPARQICEVLYQGHQQYFENMWSGLGECELYQTEQAKKAKNIKVITI